MRKWLPAALIVAAYVTSFAMWPSVGDPVPVDLRGLLPEGWVSSGPAEEVPRLLALFGVPTLALLVWALLHEGPISPFGRFTARVFFNSGEPRYDVFAPSYRLMVIWVVCMVLSLHVAVLTSGVRVVGLTLGIGLALVGNAMPRLRPNAVAGFRTARTISDPVLWARVHRLFGAVWLVAGLMTIAVAIVLPSYAVVVGIGALALASIGGLLAVRPMALGRLT